MRATLKRRQRNRRLLILTVAVVIVAVVVIAAYALSSLQPTNEPPPGQLVSPALYQQLYSVAHSSFGDSNTSLISQLKSNSGQSFTAGGKPVVVYIGADYCPYCAFQRWPIIIALMRFGNFTNLHYMLSSSTDVFPNSPTFTFYGSSYTSNYISFQPYEEQDRSQNQLQTAPSNYTAVFAQYGSSFPFLDIGNKYVVSGSFEYPTLLDGKNQTQIAQLLGGTNPLSSEVMDSANVITAAICKLTGGSPGSICGVTNISGLTVSLTAYNQSTKTSFTNGLIVGIPNLWASPQYTQATWVRTNSPMFRHLITTVASD